MKKASIPSGTRDFLPEQMRQRLFVINKIKSIFERFGYEPMETPSMEKWDVLQGKLGDEGEQLLFKILRRGTAVEDLRLGRTDSVSFTSFDDVVDLALRYDLTVPFSRVLAMNGQLAKPFKRYQIQPVWRADRPQKGRYREFYQCDVDIAGTDSILADTEILTIVYTALKELGFSAFRIRLNHRKLLNGLVAAAGGAEHFKDICIAIDKLDKIGEDGVKKELQQRGVSEETSQKLLQWMSMKDEPLALIDRLVPIIGDHEDGQAGLKDLKTLYNALIAQDLDTNFIPLDLYLVRGLDYYTGPIFEAVVDEPAIGSLSGGGRYDKLIGKFSGTETPAVGATIGLERIIDVMQELGLLDALPPKTQVLVTIFSEESLPNSLRFAQQLRAAGVCAELHLKGAAKIAKQIKYANDRAIPIIAILGPEEVENQTVQLRTGPKDQVTVPQAEAPAKIQELWQSLFSNKA
ncbi:MAG: histidine--tRNA ligase [Myxococcales bacterium]|nr:histidine--tRNA ligase [Myxococcales bacterium]MCB9642017.1 histidine--tRNA ligase [Myxococcales bacterium]